jgi:hypothetical protein
MLSFKTVKLLLPFALLDTSFPIEQAIFHEAMEK